MSTQKEKIEAQKMAFESQPTQPWHRHMVSPTELEMLLGLLEDLQNQTFNPHPSPELKPTSGGVKGIGFKLYPLSGSLPVIEPITTKLDSTEDAENDRLYDKWNKKERHD